MPKRKGTPQEKLYTFPEMLSNFPQTREIREAAEGTEGAG